jgi:Fe-S-cluster-containing dehydrogenase component/DMSO reductase anchor subunit
MAAPGSGVASIIRSPLLRVAGGRSAAPPAPAGGLLEALLREQQSLTAVERFARAHDDGALPPGARRYSQLLPRERPGPGQQYAFEVNLDACTGCKACVAACHSLNGLDEAEIWRTVGLLHGDAEGEPVQQTVTTACHHCVDPACMNGCPVGAYEKDPVTGIVRHLDDQCFGCQYCTLMCPYDAPKYSASKGIVRKCDMCADRLVTGEAPACVQGCPNEAIRITVVDQARAIQRGQAGAFLPGAPAPDDTAPTTVYATARPEAAARLVPADVFSLRPEHSHPPLVVMLVLTQLAVGAFAGNLVLRRLFALPAEGPWALAQAGFALALGLLALGASTLHLGRPRYAYRAVLGLRTSWLSREALAFGLFAKCGLLYAAALLADRLPAVPGREALRGLRPVFEAGAVLFGLVGVVSSVMVYVATRRAHWRPARTAFAFGATTALLGAAAVYAAGVLGGEVLAGGARAFVTGPAGRALLTVVILVTLVKLLREALVLHHARDADHGPVARMARLMRGDLAPVTRARFAAGAVGGVLVPALYLAATADGDEVGRAVFVGAAVAMFLLLLAGELLERYLFFRAAPASRMPGGLP